MIYEEAPADRMFMNEREFRSRRHMSDRDLCLTNIHEQLILTA